MIVEAVVQMYDSRWHPTTPRAQRFMNLESARHQRPDLLPTDPETKFVTELNWRPDGWLEVDADGYRDGNLDLFPPTSIMFLRMKKPKVADE